MKFLPAVWLATALSLGGCQSTSSELPRGTEAYTRFPAAADVATARDYKIGPLDVLAITVFQEPDLSFKELQVDASGSLLFPLIGDVRAAGKTAHELSKEIAGRLSENYLTNPQVAVVVSSSVSQRVIVEGSVVEPGVYEISGSSTLLEAVARAKSPTRTANLDEVVVFRVVNGQRMGAVFNLTDIRSGRAPDPEILGGDVVVVGYSFVKGAFRDFLTAAPLLAAFRPF
ncbi:MAG: polysaccharide biosynthesis/export family protein [Sphingomonas sp.]